ncbi:MAG: hypothetical protein E6Q97_36345 [Desulfurellales bacterium]|nr:MAG: hypothetical protein E6Q97_36345 [Desulfurellales bacterium]
MVAAVQYDLAQPNGLYPDIRDVHERVGRAIMQLAWLAHGLALTRPAQDAPIMTDLAELRTIRQEVLDPDDDAAPTLAKVGKEGGGLWGWFRFLNEPESATCVRPDDVAEGMPGRWVKQALPPVACCATTRYLAHVEYLAAQVDNRHIWNRARGKTPALFISPMGDEIRETSQTMGYMRLDLRYQCRFVSANWRGGVSARMEAPLEEEAIDDPGTQRMVGDLRRLLIHENTLMTGVPWMNVEKTSLGSYRPLFQKDAERIVVDATDIRVIAYVHTPNTPCDVVYPWTMWIQLQDELRRNAGDPFQVPPPPPPSA